MVLVPGPEDSATEILPTAADRAAVKGSSVETPLIGRTLGKFSILERIGRGGSGEVFRAEQVQLGRSVVIKVLRREVANVPNRVERFLREARLASRLDHPYAAHVYAFGAEPDGVLWIAMEHVRGMTLDELIARRGPTPPAIFAPLFGRLCEVVHTAHELGIVHRDIKGSNVMVIERAGQLLPKLLDFGIAKGIDGATTPGVEDETALTGHGATLGSPHYMSPEQWRSPGDVDARADIYALGVLAYRCVTGQLPFHRFDRLSLPTAHLEVAPPALPATVAQPLADVILRALAKQPDARWPTALTFGEAVRRAIGGAAPEAVPIFDPAVRDTWVRNGPQPIADAVSHLASATTTVEADAALRELVAITCRWLAVLALAQLPTDVASSNIRDKARATVGRDNGAPWLWLARAVATSLDERTEITDAVELLPELRRAIAGSDLLEALADRLDDRDRTRTLAALAADVAAAADALRPLEPLLSYLLVVGRAGAAESWQGTRRRDRERVVVWGEPLADGQVALLDNAGTVAVKLSPLVQVMSPSPSAEPELFLLWRNGRGQARLVAAPWGFEFDDEAAAQRLAVLTTEDSDTLAEAQDDRSPYPGLAAYAISDAERFVGREREIESLANRLVRAPMIAVLGPSGAGKSSFIHAGLMARLAENYELISMRPGRHPLHALAALPPIGTETEDSSGIVDRLRALGERAPRGLVVVIDQLEELVTLCSDPDERRRFAETLAAAADGPSAPVRIVVTLRDDFASVLESEEAFRGMFDVFVLATPLPEALRRIVTEPARRAQVSVDPRVVEDMVAEVAGRPASLPLLSFTASQLWQTRDRAARKITYEAYLALGGVAGALSTYADQLYGSLARKDQDIVRDLFSRLVATDGTRIPAPRSDLDQLPGARGVLAHLIDARLLVVREDEGVDIVEIVHECLAERWPRLARWRTEHAADRALLTDVSTATRRWQDSGRRSDLLWRGEALAELRKLVGRSGALTEHERAFAADADRAERRSKRLRRAIVVATMAVLGVVAVVMAYLSIEANHSRSAAEQSAGAAHAAASLAEERLTAGVIAQGRRELNDNRGLAALAYFGEALRRGADTPGLRYMIAVAARGIRNEKAVLRDMKAIAITALPVGFAVGDVTGKLHLFDAAATRVASIDLGIEDIRVVRATGDRAVVVGRKGIAVVDHAQRSVLATIQLADVGQASLGPADDEISVTTNRAVEVIGFDGTSRRKLDLDLEQMDTPPVWGQGAVFLGIGATAQVVDLRTMKRRVLASEIYSGPSGSADGSTVGILDKQRVAHVFNGDGTPHVTFRPAQRSEMLYLSMTGDRIGTIGDRSLGITDRDGKEIRVVAMSPQDEEMLVRIRGDDVWTGSTHGIIRHYHEESLVASLPSHINEVEDLRLAGDYVISAGFDASVVIQTADVRQFVLDEPACDPQSYSMTAIAIGYVCGDGRAAVYIGRRLVGMIQDTTLSYVAFDPTSRRAAVVAKVMTVFEADGSVLATGSETERGPLAFEDKDHLVALRDGDTTSSLWRYTIPSKTWSKVVALSIDPAALVVASGRVFVGGDASIVVLRDGREVGTIATSAPVDSLAASADARWVSAHLANGATLLLDATTGTVARQLEPVETLGVAAVLDATGDLAVRTSRGTLTVWERATGDNLVWNLEFLRGSYAAAFDSEGRLEVAGQLLGLIDIRRETRPAAEILREIECRVPLRVEGSRLESTPVRCAPGVVR